MKTEARGVVFEDEVIERKVIEAVAAALDLEPSQVTIDSSLEADLGAESLDFLDLAFALEREFEVRLPRLNILQRAEEHYGEGTLLDNGALTELGASVLGRSMPEVDPSAIRAGLRRTEIGRLITVRTFVRVVHQLLAHKQQIIEAGCECGGTLTAEGAAPELACGKCAKTLFLPPGDDVLMAAIIAQHE